jgi:CRISPR-associated endonuclease Cas1
MRDLTPLGAGALCFDPMLEGAPRLRLRSRSEPEGPVISPTSLVACPRWIQPTFDALAECAEHACDVAILRGSRIAALVRSQRHGPTTALRRLQFRRHADEGACPAFAVSLVDAKLRGQQAVMRRLALRSRHEALGERADRIERERQGLGSFALDALRGREGIAARTYFGGWPSALDLPGFQRIPRRAQNPINHLLDIAYSRLCLAVTLGLLERGLDLGLGVLHVDDDRRPTLALDLMEPLRPLIADRFVLAVYRDALAASWMQEHNGRWQMTPEGRRRFQARWTTWLHGGPRRRGQLFQVDHLIAQYRAWLQPGQVAPGWNTAGIHDEGS